MKQIVQILSTALLITFPPRSVTSLCCSCKSFRSQKKKRKDNFLIMKMQMMHHSSPTTRGFHLMNLVKYDERLT